MSIVSGASRPRHAKLAPQPAKGTVPRQMLGGSAVVVVAVGLGVMSRSSPTVVLAVAMLVVGLTMIKARPAVWIALALTVSWTSRLLTTTGVAPRFVDFLDFPLVVVAFVGAVAASVGHLDGIAPEHRKIGRRLLLLAAVMSVSWAFGDLGEPQRLLAALVLTLEPFLLLVAVILVPLNNRERRMLIVLTVILLSIQIPASLLAAASGATGDDVQGTLVATGAGHHVSAGGIAIGFFLLLGLRAPRTVLIPFGLAALAVMVISDAKQVLFALPLALAVLGFTQRRAGSSISTIGGVLAGAVMAAAATTALLTYQSTQYAFEFIDRSVTNDTGKIAVALTLWDDLQSSPRTSVFGLGPGESVSRFSFLTTPTLVKAGSPVTQLGLHPSAGADRYAAIAADGPYTGNSSFTGAQSSALGILGDYGLAGLVAYLALIASILGALRRSTDRGLRSAALASWTMLLPLSVVFDWLEQPPFTLAVLLVTAVALRSTAMPETDETEAAVPDLNATAVSR